MHKKIWFKIHWFLGITAGIVLLIMGTSGAIMSFEKEILRAINKDSYTVNIPNSAKLSNEELMNKFKLNFPNARINSITFYNDLDSSVIINIADIGSRKGINYFVHPYTAEVLPALVGKDFFGFVLKLHRWLAFGGESKEIGKQLTAISTISLIVLIFTGIIIYWKSIKNSFFKSFTFSFKHKGRAFLYSMHGALGMWVLPFYLLAALTGLYWSYDWYKDTLYKISGVEKPQKFMPNDNKKEFTEQNLNELDNAINFFKQSVKENFSYVNVRLPQNDTVYNFIYFDKNQTHYKAVNEIKIEIKNQEILKHSIYKDLPLNERLMKSILPLHTGEYFGLIGQIGMFIASSLMSLFTITGFMLYIQRKRKKRKMQE